MNNQTKLTAIAALLIGSTWAGQAFADDMSWQERRLFKPSTSQMAAENRGRVVIYDQLDAAVIDTALDTQFERMQHMMFTRVQYRAPDGSIVEDDDC